METSGFTLLEILTVVAMIGILMAIATPGWLQLLNTRRLGTAQNQVMDILRQTQSEAKRHTTNWEANFREVNARVEWSLHATNMPSTSITWQPLSPNIRIDPSETTLSSSGGVYRIQFDPRGNANGQLGRLTLKPANDGRMRRCVVVSTVLGAMRKGENHSRPQNGRYCY